MALNRSTYGDNWFLINPVFYRTLTSKTKEADEQYNEEDDDSDRNYAHDDYEGNNDADGHAHDDEYDEISFN